jgi:hypothetical protein
MVVVGGDLKGTGHHAVATADALGFVIVDCTVIFFSQGGYDTRRDTGRVLTLHALDLDICRDHLIPLIAFTRIVAVYNRVGPGARPSLSVQHPEVVERHFGRGQAVDFIACQLAFTAANACIEIHQQAVGVRRGFGFSGGPGPSWNTGQAASKRGSGYYKKLTSVDLQGILLPATEDLLNDSDEILSLKDERKP